MVVGELSLGATVLCWYGGLSLEPVRQLEFSAERVDQFLDLVDVATDLTDDFPLFFNLLVGQLKHCEVFLAHILRVLLLMVDLLDLHGQSLNFKLHLFIHSGLLLDLAIFALLNSLI